MPTGMQSVRKSEVDQDAVRVKSSGTICEFLEKEILSGKLVPGQRLDEAAIGALFGVSRTPVREAFLQLAAVDLIQLRPRHGAIVAGIPLGKMAQMFEVMAELEALCASLAAQRMNISERAALRLAMRDCTRYANRSQRTRDGGAAEIPLYFDANYAFHQLIYQGAHNDHLCEMTLNLRNRLTPYRRFRLQSPARLRSSSDEHQGVFDAIVAGDSSRAAQLMREHLTIQSALLADIALNLEQSSLAA